MKKLHFSRKKEIPNKGTLYITSSFSNIFITLKKGKKVVCSMTGGSCKESSKNNKRFKLSPGTISNMAKKINLKLKENYIKDIDVICKVSLRYIIKMFLSSLFYYDIKIHDVKVEIPFTHNGVRGRKLKRK
jgi:ribosomal protein S11